MEMKIVNYRTQMDEMNEGMLHLLFVIGKVLVEL